MYVILSICTCIYIYKCIVKQKWIHAEVTHQIYHANQHKSNWSSATQYSSSISDFDRPSWYFTACSLRPMAPSDKEDTIENGQNATIHFSPATRFCQHWQSAWHLLRRSGGDEEKTVEQHAEVRPSDGPMAVLEGTISRFISSLKQADMHSTSKTLTVK